MRNRVGRALLLLSSGLAAQGLIACGAGNSNVLAGPDMALPMIPVGTKPPPGPPAHTVGGFTIEIPATTLMPGEETLPCFVFPLVIDGPSRYVGAGSLTVGPGLHHGNIVTRKKTGDGIRTCDSGDNFSEAVDVANGGSVLFGSSTQIQGSEWQHFPDGMAYQIADDQEIVARLHYLNASTDTVTVAPKYQWYTIDPASLTQELAPFAWEFQQFTLPPLTRTTITGSCDLQKPMFVVSVLPHMHRMGVEFDAGYVGGPLDGKQWLQSKGYDPSNGVLQQYTPPVDLSQGTGATFSCTWQNTLDKTLMYGIGDNEMCTLFGYAYPPANAYSILAGVSNWCVATTR